MIYITVCLILYPITLPFAGLCRSPAYNENKLNAGPDPKVCVTSLTLKSSIGTNPCSCWPGQSVVNFIPGRMFESTSLHMPAVTCSSVLSLSSWY